MLADLQLRNFRCFELLGVEFSPGFNFFIARNGQGKTSILEAACVLLRLQSQRSPALAPIIRFGEKSFAVSGRAEPRPRELAAYDQPLLEYGAKLSAMRAHLVQRVALLAAVAHGEISGTGERLVLEFAPGNSNDFARDLANSRAQESRLRQTIVGPH